MVETVGSNGQGAQSAAAPVTPATSSRCHFDRATPGNSRWCAEQNGPKNWRAWVGRLPFTQPGAAHLHAAHSGRNPRNLARSTPTFTTAAFGQPPAPRPRRAGHWPSQLPLHLQGTRGAPVDGKHTRLFCPLLPLSAKSCLVRISGVGGLSKRALKEATVSAIRFCVPGVGERHRALARGPSRMARAKRHAQQVTSSGGTCNLSWSCRAVTWSGMVDKLP